MRKSSRANSTNEKELSSLNTQPITELDSTLNLASPGLATNSSPARLRLCAHEARGIIQAPLCECDAKGHARLAAELLRFDEVLDQDTSIRFDDTL